MSRMIGILLLTAFLPAHLLAQASLESRPLVVAAKDLSPAEEKQRDAEILFALGVMRQRGDRWLEAVKFLEEAAQLEPDCPAADRALITLYLALAREDDALDACRRVLKRDPRDSETAYELAKLLKADGRVVEAIESLLQGVKSNRADKRPDRHYFMLTDLAELQEKQGDNAGAIVSYRALAQHLIEERAWLVGGETLTAEAHAIATARAFEKVGHAHLKEKRFAEAVRAFQESRDFLARHSDPQIQSKAVRLNWNMAQASMAQAKWDEASWFFDAYLEQRPADPEPYEQQMDVLRKRGRDADVLPMLKKHAERSPDVLAIQLLYGKELARDAKNFAAAEALYRKLATRFAHADIYRGLFKVYQSADKMVDVLDLFDSMLVTVTSKEDIGADVREAARERGRLMLQVLRGEPGIVNALLPVALDELRGQRHRKNETWQFLASLAGRTHQLDKAEIFFRRCLTQTPDLHEASVYAGLLEVLWRQHKYDAVITLCRDALDGPRKAEATNILLFRRSLAQALSETDKPDLALREIDEAIKLSTEAGKVFERCRKAHILARAERYKEAIAECEELLKDVVAAAEIKQVRNTLSGVYQLKGDHVKSEEQLLKILEDDPNDPGANNNLGYQWADRNQRLEEAEKMIRRALEVDHIQRRDDPEEDPENAAYLDSLGWVLFRKGKLTEARELLEKSAAMYQGAEDPTVWDHLGDVYFKLELTDKAKEVWTKAVKLYDHDRRGQKEGRQEEARRKLKMLMK